MQKTVRIAGLRCSPQMPPAAAREQLAPGRWMQVQPQTLEAGPRCGIDRTRQALVINVMGLDHQRRLRACHVEVGERQLVAPRQVLHQCVNQCAHAPRVHRAIVDRNQLVTTHQAELPSIAARPARRERDTIAVAEPLGCPRPGHGLEPVRPTLQSPLEVVLLLRQAGHLVHAPVTAAVARRLASRRQFLV